MTTLITIAVYVVFAAVMVYLGAKDIRERRVPNKTLLLLIGLWASWRGAMVALLPDDTQDILIQSTQNLAAACIVLAALMAFGSLYERMRRKPSMGMGDIKLISVFTLYIGVRGVGICLIVACMVGFIFAIVHAVRCDPIGRGIPFAACLSCGMFMTFLLI